MTRKKGIILMGILAAVLMVAGGILWVTIGRVKPIQTEFTYELGAQETDQDITHYIEGSSRLLDQASIDMGDLDLNAVGDYTVICHSGKKEFEFVAHVVDTTGPEIWATDGHKYGTENEYDIEDFVTADDLSGVKELELLSCKLGEEEIEFLSGEEIVFDQAGLYEMVFEASDPFENSSRVTIPVEILECPHFNLLEDRLIRCGDELDFNRFVTATDKDGNDLTDMMVIDMDGYDCETKGIYTITYTVTDQDGITGTGESMVVVSDCEQSDYGIIYEDIPALCEQGYFAYEALGGDDFEAATKLVEPTLLFLYNDRLKKEYQNSYKGSSSGSGVIYRIDPDYLYISTNRHVIVSHQKWLDELVVRLYDGTEFTLSKLPESTYDAVVDTGMYRIPVQDIPINQLLQMKMVTLIEEQDESMSGGEELFVYCPQWGAGEKCMLGQVSLVTFDSVPTDCQEYAEQIQKEPEDYFYTTRFSISGMSGTGVFDYRGNFVGNLTGNISSEGFSADINVDNEWSVNEYQFWN